MPEIIEKELTLEDLRNLIKEGSSFIEIDSPEGWVPITHFIDTGFKPCLRINHILEVSIDHPMDIKGCPPRTEARYLKIGDFILSYTGWVEVKSIEYLGEKEVSDISVDHLKKGHHRFYAEGYSVYNCRKCGKCNSTPDIIHVTKGDYEVGKDSFELVKKEYKNSEPYEKFLAEIWIEPGVYSAMRQNYLKILITRAILKATNGGLVDCIMDEKSMANTRQGYRIKQDFFKSLLSGSYIHEFVLNNQTPYSRDELLYILKDCNKYTTKGWKFIGFRYTPADSVLRNLTEYSIITYRFDSRKVNHIDFPYLSKRISKFMDSNTVVKYKAQKSLNQAVVRIEVQDFDKSKILSLSASIGRNQHETVLRVISKVEDVHPLIFLAGFLGDDSPKSYVSLYGTDIIIEGFYKHTITFGSVFDLEETEHSVKCPKCGQDRLINIMTSKPFGNHPNETLPPEFLEEYPQGLCQFCWSIIS